MKTNVLRFTSSCFLSLGACSDGLGSGSGSVELRTDQSSYLPGDLIEATIVNRTDRAVEHTRCLYLERWTPEREKWPEIFWGLGCPPNELPRLEEGRSRWMSFRIPERFQPDPEYRLRLEGVTGVAAGMIVSEEFEIGYPPP